MVTRVSTFGLFNQTNQNVQDTQRRIQELTIQISSGKQSRDYEGLASRSNSLVNLENELERIQQYTLNVDNAERRLNEMETNIASIIDSTVDFRTTLLSARNDNNAQSIPLDVLGRQLFDQIAAFLNAEQDNRFLFSGTKTDTPPVKSFTDVSNELQALIDTGGSGLDVSHLAPAQLTNSANGLPIRAQQVMDFFTNDRTYGTIGRDQLQFDLNQPFGASSLAADGQVESTPNYVGNPFGSAGTIGANESQELLDFQTTTRAVSFRDIFYQGNDETLTARIEDEVTVDYSMTANQAGFEQVLIAAWIIGDSGGGTDFEAARTSTSILSPAAAAAVPGVTAGNTIDFTSGGAPVTVTLTGTDLTTIAADINGTAGIPVTATVVTDSVGRARLQIESSTNQSLTIADNAGASGAALGIVQTPSNADLDIETRIDVALQFLETALESANAESLTNLRSEVGADINQADSARLRHNQFEIAFEETVIDIEDTDIATAATELANAQLILESSFLTISSISQLSLANFLR